MKICYYKLILITQKLNKDFCEYASFLKICIQNGVTCVQLREKSLDNKSLLCLALKIKKFLYPFKIPFIINDNIELALHINADGLHLGQEDGSVFYARKLLGPNKILGLTVNSFEQIEKANDFPIDYIGVGAIFYTKNKPNIQKIWGCKVNSSSKCNFINIEGITQGKRTYTNNVI